MSHEEWYSCGCRRHSGATFMEKAEPGEFTEDDVETAARVAATRMAAASEAFCEN
jgi:hypothetical protein